MAAILPDDTFKCILMKERFLLSIRILLKFDP